MVGSADSNSHVLALEDVSADPFAGEGLVVERDHDRALAISAGMNQLMVRDTPLLQPEAAELVRADLWIMERIKGEQERYVAASAMAEAASLHDAYKTELKSQSPEVAAEVDAAAAEDKRRTEAKDQRKAEAFTSFEEERSAKAAAWTAEEAKLQAAQDLAALREK